jgi:tetratricopeptide (TPR) repeat protein
LDLTAKEDRMGRAGCLGSLGSVAHERFLEARKANRLPDECVPHLSHAKEYCKQALEMLPANAVPGLSVTHNELGGIHYDAGEIEAAIHHFRKAIHYCEAMQDRFSAGQVRYNAARTVVRVGRFTDAREWAQSALRDFQACENADQKVVKTLKLLERIESDLRGTSPPS